MPAKSDSADTSTRPRLNRAVVLVGLMGAGKTSVGRLLAQRLGLLFVDADAEIEAAAGSTIEEIFAHDGEAVFRSGERRVIARLLRDGPQVIATGGGAWMDPVTREAVRASGVSVWLKADLETLVKRTARRSDRPLLKRGNPREVLGQLIETRYPVYAEADVIVETSEDSPEHVTERVIAALEQYLGIAPLALPAETRPQRRPGGPRAKQRAGARTRRRGKS